jgi:hypothetical protein
MRELIFIHGMSQQKKDAAAIKEEWTSALKEGLAKSSLTLPSDVTIRFPYYGDTLFELVQGMPADQVASIVIKGEGASTQEQEFIRSILLEASDQSLISQADIREVAGEEAIAKGPLNWGWVRAQL